MGDKFFLVLFIISFAIISQAQEKRKFTPPDIKPNIYTFTLPELQVNSIFIANLESVLFDRKCHFIDSILSNPNESEKLRHFHFQFEKIDSSNYSIIAMLEDFPAIKSVGFSRKNKYYYWFGGILPPNLILKKKSKKRFSYKDYSGFFTTDPPLWILKYNCQAGYIEIIEKPCY